MRGRLHAAISRNSIRNEISSEEDNLINFNRFAA